MATHPQLVGNSFVSQFYNVLRHTQSVVHRFYNDQSCLTRALDGPHSQPKTVFSQSGIFEEMMSVDYRELRAEIISVDCQDSYNGSVLVMVTGRLAITPPHMRDFVQTFFLAPQEKGYYVLNDIFRFLDAPPKEKEPSEVPHPAGAPNVMESNDNSLAVAEEDVLAEEVYDHEDTEEDEVVAEEMAQASEDVHVSPSSEAEAEAEAEAENEHDRSSSQDDLQGDHPKKSYASILGGSRHQAGQKAEKTSVPTSAQKIPASPQMAPTLAPQVPPPMDTTVQADHASTEPDGNGNTDGNADGNVVMVAVSEKSIYVKNLALGTTPGRLEEELRRFGAIKPNGVNIKKLQQVCYAFVEFEEVSSGRAAVEASPILMDGKPVYIEVKRPQPPRGGYRGGRGRGRSEGGRPGGSGRGRGSGGDGGYYGGRGGRGGSSPTGGSNSNASVNHGNYGGEARGRGFRGGAADRYDRHGNSNHEYPVAAAGDNVGGEGGYHPRYENGGGGGGGNSGGHSKPHRRSGRGGYRGGFQGGNNGGGNHGNTGGNVASSPAAAPAVASN